MPPKKKRFVTETQQKRLLEDLYNQIDDDDMDFADCPRAAFEDSDSEYEPEDYSSDENNDCHENDLGDVDMEQDVNNMMQEENIPLLEENDEEQSSVREEVVAKQKFRTLDEVTNLDNFDDPPIQEVANYEYSDKKKTFVVKWHTTNNTPADMQLDRRGRRSAENIARTKGGPTAASRNVENPVDSWELFFTDEILKMIIDSTNRKIDTFREEYNDELEQNDKNTHCRNIDLIELKAFFGIMYLRGAKHLNLSSTDDLFYHESSLDIFSSTMQYKRYSFLRRFLDFDDKETRADRWQYDKYACFREVFEAVNKKNATLRTPSMHLSIDETLYPYRGRIGFKQYNPSKPAKYGLLYRSICDSEVQYCYFTLPYAGKPEKIGDQHPASKFYVTGTDEYSKYLVTNLQEMNDVKGRNISMDRYFTSVTLARWCLERKITIVGTMRMDRKGIPPEIKTFDNREEKSTMFVKANNEKLMLVSYIDKKKSGKKNIILLTTMHKDIKISRDLRTKPQPIVFYDYTKGGVDIVDLLSSSLSTRIKSKRWTINALVFLLDTVRTNSRTIYLERKDTNISNFQYTWKLGKSLVLPHMQRRFNNPVGLQASVMQKMWAYEWHNNHKTTMTSLVNTADFV